MRTPRKGNGSGRSLAGLFGGGCLHNKAFGTLTQPAHPKRIVSVAYHLRNKIAGAQSGQESGRASLLKEDLRVFPPISLCSHFRMVGQVAKGNAFHLSLPL